MSRRRKLTIEHTVETTRVTAEETIAATTTGTMAPGWDTGPLEQRHLYRVQRDGQVGRCLDFLAIWAASAEPGTPPPGRLIGDATVILRAGPGATLSELTLGRSV